MGEVNINGISVNEVIVAMVPIVREFLDVFLNHLPRLPPDLEIEFGIVILLGTALVSKAPYRMAPMELQELQIQLEELQIKGFILDVASRHGVYLCCSSRRRKAA